MAIEFTDNSAIVKAAIDDAIVAFLYEAGGEMEAQAKRNQDKRSDTGQTMDEWTHTVDESKGECVVGNPLQNAIWEEFGTGEYAVKGNGRKGYWVYVKNSDGNGHRSDGKQYTLEQAKQIMAMLREQGLEAYYTKGKTPNHTLQKAFDKNKNKLIRRFGQIMNERTNT